MVGDLQYVISPVATMKMHRQIPGSRLLVLPGQHGTCIATLESGTAHPVQKENRQAEVTVTLIEEFLTTEFLNHKTEEHDTAK